MSPRGPEESPTKVLVVKRMRRIKGISGRRKINAESAGQKKFTSPG